MEEKDFWQEYMKDGGYQEEGGSPIDLMNDDPKWGFMKDELNDEFLHSDNVPAIQDYLLSKFDEFIAPSIEASFKLTKNEAFNLRKNII